MESKPQKRVFLIVLDSMGIGALPDAADYGDAGSNTLASVSKGQNFSVPNLRSLGLFNLDGVTCGPQEPTPIGAYARMAEASKGKDTTVGHWEIAGLISQRPLPTYPNGFPPEVLEAFSNATGRGVLCNKPYSGTQLLTDYGRQHVESGDFIVYTSADSVFQIAAHEQVVPLEELYKACESARAILQGEHGVGRVIARPFVGEYPDYRRTPNRHDYSLAVPGECLLDVVEQGGLASISVGKIRDIFAGRGVTLSFPTTGNAHGQELILTLLEEDFTGLCFVNLVDFDMLYGHRNDVEGYAAALTAFDSTLGEILPKLQPEDLLIITADHGCDPSAPGTDHSREYVPCLLYGSGVPAGKNLGTRPTFGEIAATALRHLGLPYEQLGHKPLQTLY